MKLRLIALLAVVALAAAACGDSSTETTTADTAAPSTEAPATTDAMADLPDIVDTAVAAGDFTTLATALEAADLIGTLKGEGPFTVFAPTDAAFAALPEGTLEALLADIPTLTDILLYHVVPGEVKAETVVTLDSATTAQGSDVTITVDGSSVMVNDANVTMTDIQASNGVIHVIDAVLLP
jgi:uncharacterized surface protein with fasciclin (FAS1) repeats